jgi:hypothetical protein
MVSSSKSKIPMANPKLTLSKTYKLKYPKNKPQKSEYQIYRENQPRAQREGKTFSNAAKEPHISS